MASNFKLSNAFAAALAGDGSNRGALAFLAGGRITFYDGVQPTNPDTAVSGQNNYGYVAFASPVGVNVNGALTFSTASNGTCLYSGTMVPGHRSRQRCSV